MSNPAEPWAKHEKLVGRTIVRVRSMTEAESEYWGMGAIVLDLDNGESWWLSADSEGNRSGDIHPIKPERMEFLSGTQLLPKEQESKITPNQFRWS